MNQVIVIGYDSRKRRTAKAVVLYCGSDAEAGRQTHYNPPKGIVKTAFVRNPEGRYRVHDPERKGAPEGEVVSSPVEVLDFPAAKGVIALLVESLDEANKRLGEAEKPQVIVFLAEGLTDLDEEDAKQFDALKALEDATRTLGAKEEDHRKLLEQLKEKDEQVLMLANAAAADGATLEALRKELDALKAAGSTASVVGEKPALELLPDAVKDDSPPAKPEKAPKK